MIRYSDMEESKLKAKPDELSYRLSNIQIQEKI